MARDDGVTLAQKAAAGALALALIATGFGWLQTGPPAHGTAGQAAPSAQAPDLVDQSTLATAQRLALLAATPEEQSYAQSAVRIADHELALTFSAALRDLEAHPPALSPAAQQIENRRQRSLALQDGDQRRVTELTAALARARAAEKPALQDELELAQSQLELDKDEFEEASQDLSDAGGNQQQRIEAMVQEHEAQVRTRVNTAAGAAAPAGDQRGLLRKLRHWWSLRQRTQQIEAAASSSEHTFASLSADRLSLSARLDHDKGAIAGLSEHTKGAASAGTAPAVAPHAQRTHTDAQALLDQTKRIAADQRVLTLLDRRIADHRQLAAVYQQWSGILALQARALAHADLLDVAMILALSIGLLILDAWFRKLLDRPKLDRRQLETLRSITRAGLRVVVVLLILLIVFGVPSNLGTVLGLVGAGLTVAMKDFIVAFFGWLVLMGKNGIRLGDWVEINGVSGEVIQLGMFHTVLLETGNSSDVGHPTGRRVTFTNSFAIEGHYFNFSTSGQWLWDQLQLVVPSGQDPYPIVEAISKEVNKATEQSAREAEQEWRRAVPLKGGGMFSGAPSVNLKPIVGGVEISLRYITRANERFALRANLYQAAVKFLGHPPPP